MKLLYSLVNLFIDSRGKYSDFFFFFFFCCCWWHAFFTLVHVFPRHVVQDIGSDYTQVWARRKFLTAG